MHATGVYVGRCVAGWDPPPTPRMLTDIHRAVAEALADAQTAVERATADAAAEGGPVRCARCRFWQRREPDTNDPVPERVGECRRDPPVIAYGQLRKRDQAGSPYDGFWPHTLQSEWCGAFQPRPDRPASGYPAAAP
jgi:hypothetical protein